MKERRKDDFKDLAAALAKVYNMGDAAEVFSGGYGEQLANPAFTGALLFNCMVMNAVHGCRRGGCKGCTARAFFDGLTDAAARERVAMTMAVLDGKAGEVAR